jgi:predicted RNase H-like nuclease
MLHSNLLTWTLLPALALAALWFLSRGLRPASGAGASRDERLSHLVSHVAHAVMAAAMMAMLWPMP